MVRIGDDRHLRPRGSDDSLAADFGDLNVTTLHSLLVTAHIAVGSIALLLFWVPTITKKGSPIHIQAGRIYVSAMYIVAITAFIASIIVLYDPIGIRRPGEVVDPEEAARLAVRFRTFSLFLLMLSVLVFTSLRHGIAALRERREPGRLNRTSHKALLAVLAGLGVVVGVIGIQAGELLLMIFAGLSLSAAFNMYRDVRNEKPRRNKLVVAHLNGLIGSGIGAYTAFFAFGGRMISDFLSGYWQIVPWILPAIIGTFAIGRLSRRYQQPRARRSRALRSAASR